MTLISDQAADDLRRLGISFEPGLSRSELSRIEVDGGFEFNPDHRGFLELALPSGRGWPDWRSATSSDIGAWLQWPLDGVIFDVRNNNFWSEDWGKKPANVDELVSTAHQRLMQVPKLIPIYLHRHCVAAPAPSGSPVFSVHQTDTIYYGRNLADYFRNEFRAGSSTIGTVDVTIPFWSLLAEWMPSEEEMLKGRSFWNRGTTGSIEI